MRALTSRVHHRDIRKAFGRHDMRRPSQQSVARCSRLDPQIDSESSTRIVISGVAEVDCAFLRKKFRSYFAAKSLYLVSLRTLLVSGPKLSWRSSRELFKNAIELRQRLETDGERNFAD